MDKQRKGDITYHTFCHSRFLQSQSLRMILPISLRIPEQQPPIAVCIAIFMVFTHLRIIRMEQEDIQLLVKWFEQNKDHKLNFVEKEAIKMAVRKASTVGDLLETALGLLKKA